MGVWTLVEAWYLCLNLDRIRLVLSILTVLLVYHHTSNFPGQLKNIISHCCDQVVSSKWIISLHGECFLTSKQIPCLAVLESEAIRISDTNHLFSQPGCAEKQVSCVLICLMRKSSSLHPVLVNIKVEPKKSQFNTQFVCNLSCFHTLKMIRFADMHTKQEKFVPF